MNTLDYILILLIAGILAGSILMMIRNRKNGKGCPGCSGGCTSCSRCDSRRESKK